MAVNKYYYLDSMQFNLKNHKTDEPLTLNSAALSDETLDKILEDIDQHVRKTEKKELLQMPTNKITVSGIKERETAPSKFKRLIG